MTEDDWKAASAELDKPLDGQNVKGRKQAGRTVSYIESWHAIAEANRIFGFNGWNSETVELKCVAEKARKIGDSGKEGWGVSYTAKVRITVDGVIREGVGAGHGIDVDLGQAHESAIKEAESDSRKRALMTFGNPFGLALYDKTQSNVDKSGDSREHDRPAPKAIEAPPQKRTEPAPPAPANNQIFDGLKTALDKVSNERGLQAWAEDVKMHVQGGRVSTSERAILMTLFENKRGFLAQRSAA